MHPIKSHHAGAQTEIDAFIVTVTAEVLATPSFYVNAIRPSS
jgi:hypothetical protein